MLSDSTSTIRRGLPWPLIISLLCLSVVALPFDAIITANRRSGFLAGDIRRIIQLSEIFGHGFGLAVIGYMIWILAPVKRRFFPRLIACAILPGLLVHMLKSIVARRRPGYYYPEFVDNASETWLGFTPNGFPNHEYLTQSFPSAHAATAFGLAIAMGWMFPQGRNAFFVFAFLAAIQRVVYGAHWASDVLVGSAVGILVASTVFSIGKVDRMFAKFEGERGSQNEESQLESHDQTHTHEHSQAA